MKRLLIMLLVATSLWAWSFDKAIADDYTIPIVIDGQTVTLTLTITDSHDITLTSPITSVVVGSITPIEDPAPATPSAGWAERTPDALDNMIVQEDEFSGVTFYTDDRARLLLDSYLYPYIGTKDGSAWFRLYIHYMAKEWLFVREFSVLADEQKWEIAPNRNQVKRDNDGILVREWVDLFAIADNVEMMKAIALSDKAQIRYQGDTYRYDRTITEEEKDIILTTLAAFELLGGDFSIYDSR